MISRIPLGIDDFRTLREQKLVYVDKSHLIREILDRPGVQVLLLPRPRRFGKTLNLSMLRSFFEKRDEDLSHLFEDLAIWRAGEHRAHFQRYPVIYLSFKGTKAQSFGACFRAIKKNIEAVFREHSYLLASDRLSDRELRDFRAVLEGTADRTLYDRAILDLSACLHAHHGEKAVVLLDEYDEPIHAGYFHGFTTKILEFMRVFFAQGLKSNGHLYRAVVTGILRVARESLFSDANNIGVYSLLRPEFNTCFGFTAAEVTELLEGAGRPDLLDAVRSFYNGYAFGGEAIYNPWSILSFLASEDKLLRPYWLSTSTNDLVRELLQHHAVTVEQDIEALLEGGGIERRVDEHVALGSLRDDEDALWSLLVFSGYLKAEPGAGVAGEEPPYRLSIPNREVRQVYTTTFRKWMSDRLKGKGGSLAKLTAALFTGDAERLGVQLQAFATNLLSYHDTALDPEQVYQAFVVGLLAALEPEYQVRSNRESGSGRPDVIIRPAQAGKPGVVLELKVVRRGKRTADKALAEALAQIEERGYAAELVAAGASPVQVFAVAFDGKRVWVRAGG